MSVAVASAIVDLALGYLVLGVVFAVPFALRGVNRLDPAAARGTAGFRVLVLPGAAVLWPLLLARWWRARGAPREERSPHRLAARGAAGAQNDSGSNAPGGDA